MVSADIRNVRQILRKKDTFGHTKRYSNKYQNRLLYIDNIVYKYTLCVE